SAFRGADELWRRPGFRTISREISVISIIQYVLLGAIVLLCWAWRARRSLEDDCPAGCAWLRDSKADFRCFDNCKVDIRATMLCGQWWALFSSEDVCTFFREWPPADLQEYALNLVYDDMNSFRRV